MPIKTLLFKNQLDEYNFLAKQIKNDLKTIKPQEIAIIARRHSTLKELNLVLLKHNIPVNYEAKENILEKKIIKQILYIWKFCSSLFDSSLQIRQELLPDILSFGFWQISTKQILDIALESKNTKTSWLEVMLKSEEPEIQFVTNFLLALARSSLEENFEKIMDYTLGNTPIPTKFYSEKTPSLDGVRGGSIQLENHKNQTEDLFNTSESSPLGGLGGGTLGESEGGSQEKTLSSENQGEFPPLERGLGGVSVPPLKETRGMSPLLRGAGGVSKNSPLGGLGGGLGAISSPLKTFYFKQINAEYLDLLQDLKSLINKIREKSDWQNYSLKEVVEFIELLQKNKIEIYKSKGFENPEAISLLTAHKAKGLEFEKVYIINTTKKEWIGKAHGSKLALPLNLPFAPEKDEMDDKLRLFFVAITRAKKDLVLTASELDKKQKPLNSLEFLEGVLEFEKVDDLKDSVENQVLNLEQEIYQPEIFYDQEDLSQIKPILENYKLSVTHLQNFLDVTDRGPKGFLEKNLLNFPQAKSDSTSYGTAVHNSLRDLVLFLKKDETKKTEGLEFLLTRFEIHLKKENLDPEPFQKNLEKGKEKLATFYQEYLPKINLNCTVEKDFKEQGCVLEKAILTGKLDRLENSSLNGVTAVDYKTGKPLMSWKSTQEYEKIKAWKYNLQLTFYQVLLKHSNQYKNHQIDNLKLEFVEDLKGKIITLDKKPSPAEIQRLEKLIEIVYQKIQNLDLPDTSDYEPNLKGIKQFEEDLLLNGG